MIGEDNNDIYKAVKLCNSNSIIGTIKLSRESLENLFVEQVDKVTNEVIKLKIDNNDLAKELIKLHKDMIGYLKGLNSEIEELKNG